MTARELPRFSADERRLLWALGVLDKRRRMVASRVIERVAGTGRGWTAATVARLKLQKVSNHNAGASVWPLVDWPGNGRARLTPLGWVVAGLLAEIQPPGQADSRQLIAEGSAP